MLGNDSCDHYIQKDVVYFKFIPSPSVYNFLKLSNTIYFTFSSVMTIQRQGYNEQLCANNIFAKTDKFKLITSCFNFTRVRVYIALLR